MEFLDPGELTIRTIRREEVLRLASSGTSTKKTPGEAGILVGEMDLPSWVTKTDIGATLESLGNLYARKGNVEYAMPLYLQSISLLMPPPSARKEEPSTEEKCHAATIVCITYFYSTLNTSKVWLTGGFPK